MYLYPTDGLWNAWIPVTGILLPVVLNLIYERFSYFSDLNRNLKTHLSKMSVYVFFLHLKLYNLKFKFKSNESIES